MQKYSASSSNKLAFRFSAPSTCAQVSPLVRPVPLRKSVSWTLLGNLVYAGCQLGMLVVLAKLGSPENVGRFALGLAVTAPVMMFAGLQMRTMLATDPKGDCRFLDYLSLRAATTASALVVILGIALYAGYQAGTVLVILAMGLAKAVEGIGDVFYGLFQRHERMDRVAKSMMLKGPLSLLALGIAVYLTGSVLCGVMAMATAWATILLIYDMPNGVSFLKIVSLSHVPASEEPWEWRTPFRLPVHWRTLGKLAWIGIPLGAAVGLNSLVLNVPQYILESRWGARELGVFAALMAFIRPGFYLQTALRQPALPRLSRLFRSGETRGFALLLWKLLGLATAIGGLGFCIAMLFGRQILTIVYDSEYASHNATLTLLMLAGGLGCMSCSLKAATDATRCFFLQLPLLALVSIICAVAGLALIPEYGLVGGALSIVIARLALVVGYTVVLTYAVTRGSAKYA